MTNADLTEMEFLAATLATTAARLQRATALLRAAGDLQRLQAKLTTIVAERPYSVAAERPGAAAPTFGRAAEGIGGRKLDSLTVPVGASRVGAVFDDDAVERKKLGLKSAGARRAPF